MLFRSVERGVKNVAALTQLVHMQIVGYDFTYFQVDFPMDVSALCLSTSKTMLPISCALPLSPSPMPPPPFSVSAVLSKNLTVEQRGTAEHAGSWITVADLSDAADEGLRAFDVTSAAAHKTTYAGVRYELKKKVTLASLVSTIPEPVRALASGAGVFRMMALRRVDDVDHGKPSDTKHKAEEGSLGPMAIPAAHIATQEIMFNDHTSKVVKGRVVFNPESVDDMTNCEIGRAHV